MNWKVIPFLLALLTMLGCQEHDTTAMDTANSAFSYQSGWDEPDVDAYSAANEAKPEQVDEYLWNLAVRWCAGDHEVINELEDLSDEEMEILLEYVGLIEDAMYEDPNEATLPNGTQVQLAWSSSLPGCGSYWGTYRAAEFAEFRDSGPSGYSYYWSPNCYMPAPGTDCGTDGDNMVSFWMGPDYTTRWGDYRVDGRKPKIDLFLWAKTLWSSSSANSRLYISGGYGNAYVCLPTGYKPDNLRFGW